MSQWECVPVTDSPPAQRTADASEVLSTEPDAEPVTTDEALRRRVQHLLLERGRRRRIDQACGILMHRYGMDADVASRTLHRWSEAADLQLEQIAEAVVSLTVDDDVLPALPRETAHTVSRLLRRELTASADRSLGTRTLGRRS